MRQQGSQQVVLALAQSGWSLPALEMEGVESDNLGQVQSSERSDKRLAVLPDTKLVLKPEDSVLAA